MANIGKFADLLCIQRENMWIYHQCAPSKQIKPKPINALDLFFSCRKNANGWENFLSIIDTNEFEREEEKSGGSVCWKKLISSSPGSMTCDKFILFASLLCLFFGQKKVWLVRVIS